ncbi:IS3 family transposase [Thalassoglobus polymorphus]|uniref:HTH-like domain-containing protein n=1 Tax=Thalassoglobus polymorphus TaxID=2527994 RepID=A0A517QL73_9PLAN|nr:IS3 family transposase [Thalassoglobus polymorphus]QDT32390.1 hypothetical protein Mal48_16360 [Thalassoglobus polymorphus]
MQRAELLTGEIEEIHLKRKEAYSSLRVHQELLDPGHAYYVNTVVKLMRKTGVRARTKKKFIATTNSNDDRPVAENVLNREFNSPTKPNEVWLSDITYNWTDQGWMYLAVARDLFTKKLLTVVWRIDDFKTGSRCHVERD